MKSEEKTTSNSKSIEFSHIDSLVYKSGEQWFPFPNWAKFYIELGSTLSMHDGINSHLITAVTVPVRAFAASLITASIVLSRLELPSTVDENHAERIAVLPEGTPVSFRKNNKQYKGIYLGIVFYGQQRYFRIRYEKGTEISIPIESANKIEILNKETISIPKFQSGKGLTPPSPLLENLLDKELLYKLIMESKLECLILGQINIIQQELCNLIIGHKTFGDSVEEGTLQDIVRAKGTQCQPSNSTHRSYVWSSSSRYSSQSVARLTNHVTIFDNPLGFIKWRSFFRKSNWVVILDRTDRNFEIALKDLNEEFVQYRLEHRSKISFPPPPSGIELMVYEVKA